MHPSVLKPDKNGAVCQRKINMDVRTQSFILSSHCHCSTSSTDAYVLTKHQPPGWHLNPMRKCWSWPCWLFTLNCMAVLWKGLLKTALQKPTSDIMDTSDSYLLSMVQASDRGQHGTHCKTFLCGPALNIFSKMWALVAPLSEGNHYSTGSLDQSLCLQSMNLLVGDNTFANSIIWTGCCPDTFRYLSVLFFSTLWDCTSNAAWRHQHAWLTCSISAVGERLLNALSAAGRSAGWDCFRVAYKTTKGFSNKPVSLIIQKWQISILWCSPSLHPPQKASGRCH